MLDKRRINTINQGWQNALDSGATQIHCQAALVGQFLHHRSLETWPALGAWYSGPAKRELVGDDQVYFDLACDTLEKAIRKEALALMNGETTLVASDNGLATCFPSLDQELLKELRAYSISDFAGSLV